MVGEARVCPRIRASKAHYMEFEIFCRRVVCEAEVEALVIGTSQD